MVMPMKSDDISKAPLVWRGFVFGLTCLHGYPAPHEMMLIYNEFETTDKNDGIM